MHKKLIIFLLFCAGLVHAQSAITEENLINHVKFLSSEKIAGRLTGSTGEKLASEYVARYFQRLGFMPAGDNHTYFQTFRFMSGSTLAKNNDFSLRESDAKIKHFILNKDWRPLSFSQSVVFKNSEVVFAGYGISTKSYNSYKYINVKNKWVIVYRFTPQNKSKQLAKFSSLRYKTFNAKNHGAKGIIFVNPDDKQDELISLSVASRLNSADIAAISMKRTYLDYFLANSTKISGQVDVNKNIQYGRNVLAKLSLANHNHKTLIVGAHLDHLGKKELLNSTEKNTFYPGADDNASGVASILEAAKYFNDLKQQGKLSGNQDILFAAWSGEELGLLGSAYFMKHSHENIHAVINLDMVGHFKQNLILQGLASSTNWPHILMSVAKNNSLKLIMQDDPYLPTDATTFYLHHIPIINFFTGADESYHTPRDNYSKLNYIGLKHITEFLTELIITLEKENNLSYTDIRNMHYAIKHQSNLYLGTIPDYASENNIGVKLAGIKYNSPAEMAGMKQNDIVIKLAGKNIHDIYDYTYVMNSLHADKAYEITIMREQANIKLNIIPRYRN